MPNAHCVGTVAGVILDGDANFFEMMQRSKASLIGTSYRSITVPEDMHKSSMLIGSLIDHSGPTRLRKRYWRPDGSIVSADLLVTKFEKEDQLITTLTWTDDVGTVQPPASLWRAAIMIEHMYKRRVEELGADLFGDFVGAILVKTYLAEAEGRAIRVAEIADSIGLQRPTVLRWLDVLRSRGLLQTVDRSTDAVQLSHEGLIKVERLLTTSAVQPVA